MNSLVRTFPRRIVTLGLLHLGGVEQRRDDRCRADPDRNACLDQFGPPFVIAPVAVAHFRLFYRYRPRPYAEEQGLGRVVPCTAG